MRTMKNLKPVLTVHLVVAVVILSLLESSYLAGANNQQQKLQGLHLDGVELSNLPPIPQSQKVLDSLAAAVYDEWVTEGKNKKSKERSFRQMKPVLRFGRRSDPTWDQFYNPKLEQGEEEKSWAHDKFYNLI